MSVPAIRPEGPTSEWKEILPRPERLAKTLCAFGNSAGGDLWIGVADDGRVVGLNGQDGLRAGFQAAADLVQPTPRWRWERLRIDGKVIIRVHIERLRDGVATVLAKDGAPGHVYLREGSSNRRASARTVRDLNAGHKVKVGPKERELLRLLSQGNPQSLGQIAKALRMGERRARRLLVPLLRAGLLHDREGNRYALTARGAQRL